MCSGYPLVSSKFAKMLGFKGYLPLPLTPTPRSKPELALTLTWTRKTKGKGEDRELGFTFSYPFYIVIPGCNHFFWSLETLSGCSHLVNKGFSWTCTFWMWFSSEVHFATFSGPDTEEVALQYMWFLILCNHVFSTLQSFLCESLSSFLDNPVQTHTSIL